MEERTKIRKILHKATALLCENLGKENIIHNLKSEEALTDGDVEEIKSHSRTAEQVDAMLVILKRKPAKAYYSFMNVLWKNREDLYDEMEKIEKEFGYTGMYINMF